MKPPFRSPALLYIKIIIVSIFIIHDFNCNVTYLIIEHCNGYANETNTIFFDKDIKIIYNVNVVVRKYR
jgi:hypothetical protein